MSFDVMKLYPSVEFPVSRGTPMISPLVKWDHSENFNVAYFNPMDSFAKKEEIININEKDWNFLKGHVIDGE